MINQQRILMFNVSKEKRDKIIQMCKTLGILTKIVDRQQYNQKDRCACRNFRIQRRQRDIYERRISVGNACFFRNEPAAGRFVS